MKFYKDKSLLLNELTTKFYLCFYIFIEEDIKKFIILTHSIGQTLCSFSKNFTTLNSKLIILKRLKNSSLYVYVNISIKLYQILLQGE